MQVENLQAITKKWDLKKYAGKVHSNSQFLATDSEKKTKEKKKKKKEIHTPQHPPLHTKLRRTTQETTPESATDLRLKN